MKQILIKIGNGMMNVFGFALCGIAVLLGLQKEMSVPYAVIAVAVCPVIYWFLRKSLGSGRSLLTGIIRAVLLVGGVFALCFLALIAPYYRCYDFSVKEEAKNYFEKTLKTQDRIYKEISSVVKQEKGDYLKVIATVVYDDQKSGKTTNQDIILYFDRFEGTYYDNFDALRLYRNEHAQEFWHPVNRFEEDALNERANEIVQYVVDDDYLKFAVALDAELKGKVTQEVWRGWQEKKIAPSGAFQKVENTEASSRWAEDEKKTQTMELTVTLRFAEGTQKVRMTFHDDLTLKQFEVV